MMKQHPGCGCRRAVRALILSQCLFSCAGAFIHQQRRPTAEHKRHHGGYMAALHAAEEGSVGPHHKLEQVSAAPPSNSQVYSLATVNADGTTNMNIVTFATPVSLQPTRKWVVSLYKHTLSRKNFEQRGGVLQVMTESQSSLVHILGKLSGHDVNKKELCLGEGHRWVSHEFGGPSKLQVELLEGCPVYLRLQPTGQWMDAGDHDVALCEVPSVYVDPQKDSPLMSQRLRDEGII